MFLSKSKKKEQWCTLYESGKQPILPLALNLWTALWSAWRSVTAFPVSRVTWRSSGSSPSLWGLGYQHSRGRHIYLSILIHWLKQQKEKTREESLLKFHANFSVETGSDPKSHPKGHHKPGKMLLVNTLQFFHKEGPRKPHSYTLPLYLQFYNLTSFSWGRSHLHHTELTWFYLQLEVFHCHP